MDEDAARGELADVAQAQPVLVATVRSELRIGDVNKAADILDIERTKVCGERGNAAVDKWKTGDALGRECAIEHLHTTRQSRRDEVRGVEKVGYPVVAYREAGIDVTRLTCRNDG